MNSDSAFVNRLLPAEWREAWADELAAPLAKDAAAEFISTLVFRIGSEWFALPASTVVEITRLPSIHRVPFRDAAAIGVVNIRGRVVPCVRLASLLGPLGEESRADQRLVVFEIDQWIFATPVDAVAGVQRLDLRDLAPMPPPAPADRFTDGLWNLAGRTVARLDHPRLFAAVRESLA